MLSVYKVYIVNKNTSGVEKWYSQENTVTTKKDLYRSVVNTYELNNVQQFKQHILGHTSSSGCCFLLFYIQHTVHTYGNYEYDNSNSDMCTLPSFSLIVGII